MDTTIVRTPSGNAREVVASAFLDGPVIRGSVYDVTHGGMGRGLTEAEADAALDELIDLGICRVSDQVDVIGEREYPALYVVWSISQLGALGQWALDVLRNSFADAGAPNCEA